MQTRKCGRVSSLVLIAGVSLSWGPIAHTEPVALATVSGSVSGPDGARLPRATVTIVNLDAEIRVATGDRGLFRASGLAPGSYAVTARLAGFEPRVMQDVRLQAGETTMLHLELEVAGLHEIVSVIGAAPRDSLEASEIRESPARDVGEALTALAGVWKVRKGGIANDIVLRGLQSRDLSVLIDGQRVYGACPNQMDPASFHVDFSEVERVEIGKGPFDLKNQGSLGGAINIVTHKPEEGWKLNANLAAGSYQFVNPSATLSYGGERVSALAGYSFRSSKPYTDGAGQRFTEITNYAADAVDRSAFEIGTAWGRALWRPVPGHSLELSYGRQDANRVYYPYLLMDAIYDDTDRLALRYSAEDLGNTLTSLRVHGYLTQVSHWMTNEYRTSAGTAPRGYSMGTLAETHTIGGRVDGQLHSVQLGIEVFRRGWDARTELAMRQYAPQFSIPDVTTDSMALYAEYESSPVDGLTLTAGGRIDRAHSQADPAKANTDLYFAYHGSRATDRTDTLPSGKLRVAYRASDSSELSIGLGHTVRLPDPSELYFALQRMASDRVGNPELDPSRNTGLDAGISYERPGLSLRASVFSSWVDDLVVVHEQARTRSVSGVMNRQARSFTNVNATLIGGELDLVVWMANRLFLSGDVSYVRGRQEVAPERGVFSENLAEMPPLRAQVRLRFDDGRFWALVEGVFAADQEDVDRDLSEERTPGYAIANLSLGLRRGRLVFTAGVANLFDRYYVDHLSYQRDPFRSGVRVPEPGRNLFANLAARF